MKVVAKRYGILSPLKIDCVMLTSLLNTSIAPLLLIRENNTLFLCERCSVTNARSSLSLWKHRKLQQCPRRQTGDRRQRCASDDDSPSLPALSVINFHQCLSSFDTDCITAAHVHGPVSPVNRFLSSARVHGLPLTRRY